MYMYDCVRKKSAKQNTCIDYSCYVFAVGVHCSQQSLLCQITQCMYIHVGETDTEELYNNSHRPTDTLQDASRNVAANSPSL